jgi:hypothetical protein
MILSLLLLVSATAPEPVRWDELTLSISVDPYVSSDAVTLCRVRVVNHGTTSWPGRRLRFEARALAGGRVAERQLGRFGLVLGPHETLETVIGFSGSYRDFQVAPAEGRDRSDENRARRGGAGRRRGRKR